MLLKQNLLAFVKQKNNMNGPSGSPIYDPLAWQQGYAGSPNITMYGGEIPVRFKDKRAFDNIPSFYAERDNIPSNLIIHGHCRLSPEYEILGAVAIAEVNGFVIVKFPSTMAMSTLDYAHYAKIGERTQLGFKLEDIEFINDNDMAQKRGAKPKPIENKFDPKELDALVIAPEAREEIEAVLKQHKNASKLFEEWGLGETIAYGRGMTFCFYGTPGTGKTFATHCISKAMGLKLLVISAAEIQSSEPGAANRNIQQAFASATKEKKILFLDECDSLITQRGDVGMVLGGEINTLLTEIEKFEGICILATNRIDTLDEALERRISLIVEFPEPTHPQRKTIWEKLIPKKMPLEKEVVVEKLADHKLTGGQIKNAVLQAARLALSSESKTVTLAHFESAIARIQKSKSLMGTASRYRQGLVKEDFKRSS